MTSITETSAFACQSGSWAAAPKTKIGLMAMLGPIRDRMRLLRSG
jgi:hypothetical protein